VKGGLELAKSPLAHSIAQRIALGHAFAKLLWYYVTTAENPLTGKGPAAITHDF
jgi:hypothetical protein